MSKDKVPWQHPRGHLIPFKVRIMGSTKVAPTIHHRARDDATTAPASVEDVDCISAGSEIFIVAKDVCTLIHTSKGNVTKSVGGFTEWEKARMAVLCPRYNSSVSTHVLTVLSIAGVDRLLNTSRSPMAPAILKMLHRQINTVLDEQAEMEGSVGADAVATHAVATHVERNHSSSLLWPSATNRSLASHPSEPVLPLATSSLPATPKLSSLRTASDLPPVVTVLKKKQTGVLDDELQVSGPIVVCSLVPSAKGLEFVMQEGQDSARWTSDLMRTGEVEEDAVGKSEPSGSGASPQQSAAVQLAVAVHVDGYGLPMTTSVNVPMQSDEKRQPKRQRQCDKRDFSDDVGRQRTFGPNQLITILLQPPTTASSPPLLVEQADSVSSSQQLQQFQCNQLQHQQQRLLVAQQQQQHDLNEMIMIVQQQQQQQFMREQQWMQHLVSITCFPTRSPIRSDASLSTPLATSQSPFISSSLPAPYSQPDLSANLSTGSTRLSSTSSPVLIGLSASSIPAPAQPLPLSTTPSFTPINPPLSILPPVDYIPRTPIQPLQPAPIDWLRRPGSDLFDHNGSFNDPYQGGDRYGGY